MISETQQDQKKYLQLILIGSVTAAVLSYFIPVAATVDNPAAAHWRTSAAVLLAAPMVSSAVWFFIGLRGFKTRMRLAYTLMGVGMIIFSVAMLQLAVIGLLDQWNSAWATGGGAIMVFMLGSIFMYSGMRQFARLQGVRGILTSFWAVTGISLAVAALSGVAASFLVQYKLEGVTVYEAAVGWTGAYLACSALLARKISRAIGPSYGRAIRWQTLALVAFTIGDIHEAVTTWFLTTGDWYEDYGAYLWVFIATGVLFIRASYEFRLLTVSGGDGTAPAAAAKTTDRDYLESLIAVANLASNPHQVDPLIDDMRFITSSLPDDGVLTDAQKHQLLEVYHKLEAYLTANDPLRTYTAEQVQAETTPGFRRVLQAK